MPSSNVQLEGQWLGYGTEVQLDTNNNVKKIELKLIKNIVKISCNVYKVTETYYFKNGLINDGPVTYLLSTDGNNENFIISDFSGIGIDYYNVKGKHMLFRYNINGLMANQTPNPQNLNSLDGNFKLKRQ